MVDIDSHFPSFECHVRLATHTGFIIFGSLDNLSEDDIELLSEPAMSQFSMHADGLSTGVKSYL